MMTRQVSTNHVTLALRASMAAATVVMKVYEEGDWDVELKEDNSPLSRADRESHEALVAVLGSGPEPVPILSEEDIKAVESFRRGLDLLWVVDPLDGTKEFLNRRTEFTVNVALVENGAPILGVVTVPAQGLYYLGAQGLGSWRLTQELAAQVAQVADPQQGFALIESSATKLPLAATSRNMQTGKTRVRVVASRSHLNPGTEEFIRNLETRFDSVELLQAGSAVKLCRVAEAAADCYPRLAPTMEWDTAAGDVVVRESGGQVLIADDQGVSDGTPLRYNKEDLHNPSFVAFPKGFEL
jgi:3'(2'), 5'-bisphosphate nucleotidase